MVKNERGDSRAPLSLECVKTRFASYLRDELERSEGTIKQYVYCLSYVEKWTNKLIGGLTIDDLRSLRNSLRSRGYSSSYIKHNVVAVRALHKWGVLEGLWEPSALLLMPTPKERNNSPPPLPVEKARVLLDSCRDSLETRVVYFGLYAGTRIGESAYITAANWEDGWLRFVREKTRKIGEVPIHPQLEEKRSAILAFCTPHRESLHNAKERVEKRVGFRFVAHQLRKSFASTLYDGGTDDRVVRELLGHTQDVTGRYVTVSRRKKIEAIGRLSYEGGCDDS